jgi:hypothetical protein
MANYGELIDSNIDINRMPVYTFFLEYFGNPKLGFLKETPDGNVIYGAKIRSQLSRQKRYLFVLIKKDPRNRSVQFPKEAFLRDVQWNCLQTRILDEDYNLPQFSYSAGNYNNIIKVQKKEENRFIYSCESFPDMSVVLLIPKTQMKPYNDRGTLSLALETFNCLVYV